VFIYKCIIQQFFCQSGQNTTLFYHDSYCAICIKNNIKIYAKIKLKYTYSVKK